MRKTVYALAALLVFIVSGCGLTSGTAFISQSVDGTIVTDTRPSELRGGGNLDEQMAGVTVDLTDNSDWSDFTIEGVEDGCIYVEANNHLNEDVSGEVWIVMDLDFNPNGDPDAVRNHPDAFVVFSGLAIPADPTPGNDGDIERVFTCHETIALLQNTDRLVDAIRAGEFQAYGIGYSDNPYCFSLSGIAFGFHVTGSL